MRWPTNRFQRNTTLVNSDGSVEPGFLLKYETQTACAIDKSESEVLITGGDRSIMDKVSVYAINNWTGEVGWSYDMGSGLNVGRANHACTSFISEEKKVGFFLSLLSIYLLMH